MRAGASLLLVLFLTAIAHNPALAQDGGGETTVLLTASPVEVTAGEPV